MKRALLTCLFGFIFFGLANAAPVALVTDLTGTATLGEGQMARKLEILDQLDVGAVVALESGVSLNAVYLQGGHEYRYQGPAQVYFREDQPITLRGDEPVKEALLASDDHSLMSSVGVAQAAMVMRSAGAAGEKVELITPVNTRVLAARPDFRWRAVDNIDRYKISVEDSNEQVVWTASVAGDHARLPDDVHLVPGARYTWSVVADGGHQDDATAWANFRVSGNDTRAEVQARRPDDNAAFSERLLFAIWLQDQGLREEAQPYWEALSKERPDSRSLQALAGS